MSDWFAKHGLTVIDPKTGKPEDDWFAAHGLTVVEDEAVAWAEQHAPMPTLPQGVQRIEGLEREDETRQLGLVPRLADETRLPSIPPRSLSARTQDIPLPGRRTDGLSPLEERVVYGGRTGEEVSPDLTNVSDQPDVLPPSPALLARAPRWQPGGIPAPRGPRTARDIAAEMDTAIAEQPGGLSPDVAIPPRSDAGISLTRGIYSVPEAAIGLADIVSKGKLGQALDKYGITPGEWSAELGETYSPELQAKMANVQQAKGLLEKLNAALSNPEVIAHNVLESLPLMVAGAGVGGVVMRGGSALAGAVGEGMASAGVAAETIRRGNEDRGLTWGQAGLAATTGVATSALALLGARIAQKIGIEDIDTLASGALASPAARQGLLKAVVYGAFQEGLLEELPQSVTEQILQNAAMGRPLTEGVDEAAVMGALAGAVMGGGAQAAAGRPPRAPEPYQTPLNTLPTVSSPLQRRLRQAEKGAAWGAANDEAFGSLAELAAQAEASRDAVQGQVLGEQPPPAEPPQVETTPTPPVLPPAPPVAQPTAPVEDEDEFVRQVLADMEAEAAQPPVEAPAAPPETLPPVTPEVSPQGNVGAVAPIPTPEVSSATQEGIVPEGRVSEYQGTRPQRTPPEAGRRDSAEQGGQEQGEVAPLEGETLEAWALRTAGIATLPPTGTEARKNLERLYEARKAGTPLAPQIPDFISAYDRRRGQQPTLSTMREAFNDAMKVSKGGLSNGARAIDIELERPKLDSATLQALLSADGARLNDLITRLDPIGPQTEAREVMRQWAQEAVAPPQIELTPPPEKPARRAAKPRGFDAVLEDAKAQGYYGTSDDLRAAYDQLESLNASIADTTGAASDGVRLMRAIANAGGIGDSVNDAGEIAHLWEASTGFYVPKGKAAKTKGGKLVKSSRFPTGGFLGVGGVLRREGGRTLDQLREAVAQERGFEWLADAGVNEFLDVIDAAITAGRQQAQYPTTGKWWEKFVHDDGTAKDDTPEFVKYRPFTVQWLQQTFGYTKAQAETVYELARAIFGEELLDKIQLMRGGTPGDAAMLQPALERLKERWRRARLVTVNDAALALGPAPPAYLDQVVEFMLAQREKMLSGTLTVRDVAKAYLMTLGSIGADAMRVEKFTESTGLTPDPQFVTDDRGKAKIRPEEAVALWLSSDEGRLALDHIERGEVTPADFQDLLRVRDAYGRHFLRHALDSKSLGRNVFNLQDVTAELNGARGNSEVIGRIVQSMTGIAEGKEGFIKALLGIGDTGTVDAVELAFWTTGESRQRYRTDAAAQLVKDISQKLGNTAVRREVTKRIQQRIDRLATRYKLPPEIGAHIIHHWLWDKAKGTATTHAGMMHAMRYAQGETAFPKGSTEFFGTMEALIRALRNADITTAPHELAHVARLWLLNREVPAEMRQGITDEMITAAEDAFGVKDGVWWVEDGRPRSLQPEERFARAFERYLREGKAPTSTLKAMFDRFAQWFAKIYPVLTGSPIADEITPAMRQTFDLLVTRNERLQQAETREGPPPATPPVTTQETRGPPPGKPKEADIVLPGMEAVRGQALAETGPRLASVDALAPDDGTFGLTAENAPAPGSREALVEAGQQSIFDAPAPKVSAAEESAAEEIKKLLKQRFSNRRPLYQEGGPPKAQVDPLAVASIKYVRAAQLRGATDPNEVWADFAQLVGPDYLSVKPYFMAAWRRATNAQTAPTLPDVPVRRVVPPPPAPPKATQPPAQPPKATPPAPPPAAPEMTWAQRERALKAAGITLTTDPTGAIVLLKGKTFEWKDVLRRLGGQWIDASKSWRLATAKLDTFLGELAGRARTPSGSGVQNAAYLGDGELRRLREAADGLADGSGLDRDPESLLDPRTAALLRRGASIGVPDFVLAEQIEDVARLARAYEQKKPLFLLASEPGSGKTFVLGGAIRELRARGAERILYVTQSQTLIDQVKDNLKDYEIAGVEFRTYDGIRKAPPEESDVLIFDEVHKAKNTRRRTGRQAGEWMKHAKFVVMSSATPMENPTQAQYFEPTGVFEPFGGFLRWATVFGAYPFKDPKTGKITSVAWRRTNTSDQDAAAARSWFLKSGIYTSRKTRLPEAPGVDSRHVVVKASPDIAAVYDALSRAAQSSMKKLDLHGLGWMTNFQKRLLEAGKVEVGIKEARKALDRGRFPILFVETKAERIIDIPAWLEGEQKYQDAMENWRATPPPLRGEKPQRKAFNAPPFDGLAEVFQAFMEDTGRKAIEIPPATDFVIKEFGEDKVAVFTGANQRYAETHLGEWRRGQRPVLVATMAKGGTGLSLHDTFGDHPTTQININMPWTATGIIQVAQRSARYGLKSRAELMWIFADNIAFDRRLAARVGGRIADMGAVVHGEPPKIAEQIENFEFSDAVFEEEGEYEDEVDALTMEREDETDRMATAPTKMPPPPRRPPAPPAPKPTPQRPLLTPSELVKEMQAALKDATGQTIPVSRGGYLQKAWGIYKVLPRTIRVKIVNDLQTIFHEGGHALDRLTVNLSATQDATIQKELQLLGLATSSPKASKKKLRLEGAAELFRLWLTDPTQARSSAPQATSTLEAAIANHPTLRKLQDDVQFFLAQDLSTRGELRIDFTGEHTRQQSFWRRFIKNPEYGKQRFAHIWLGDEFGFETAEKILDAHHQGRLAPRQSAFLQFVNARYAHGMAGQAMWGVGLRRPDGTFLLPSLQKTLSPIKEQEMESFAKYLVMIRARELQLKRGIETGITHEEAQAWFQETWSDFDSDTRARFRQAGQALWAWQRNLLQILADRGQWTQDEVNALAKLYRYYVPFQRVMEDSEAGGQGPSQSVVSRRTPIYRIKGSGRDIINPLESVIANATTLIDYAEKTAAMVKLANKAEKTEGSGEIMEMIRKVKPTTVHAERVLNELHPDAAQILTDAGIDPMQLVTLWAANREADPRNREVAIMRKGVIEIWQIHDEGLWDSITTIGPAMTADVLHWLTVAVQLLRAGVTLAPRFIYRNLFRDSLTLTFQSRYAAIPFYDPMRGLAALIKQTDDAKQFLASGLLETTQLGNVRSRNVVREALHRMTGKHSLKIRTLADVPRVAVYLANPLTWIHGAEIASAYVEAGTRLGEFMRVRETGGKEMRAGVLGWQQRLRDYMRGAPQPAAWNEDLLAVATNAAADVTVPFRKGGRYTRELNQWSAFLNARVRGLVQMGIATKRDPGGVALTLGMLAMASALLWKWNHEDDDEDEAGGFNNRHDATTRMTYWLVRIPGSDAVIPIPKPYEWAALSNLVEASLDNLRDHDKVAFDAWWDTLPIAWTPTQFVFSLLPTLLAPGIGVAANYDERTGRSILREWEMQGSPKYWVKDYTTDTFRFIGESLNISPALAEHFIFQTFGTLARNTTEWVADPIVRSLTGRIRPPSAERPWREPFFMSGDASSRGDALIRYYELQQDKRRAEEDISHLTKEQRPAEVKAAREAIQDEAWWKVRQQLEAQDKTTGTTIKSLSKKVRAIYDDRTMTKEQKRSELDRVRTQMNRIAQGIVGPRTGPPPSR